MPIGFPTVYDVSFLAKRVLFADENPPVWAHPEDPHQGITLYLLHENLPLLIGKLNGIVCFLQSLF